MTKIQIIYSLIFLSMGVFGYWIILPRQWRSIFLFAASLCFMSLFSIEYTIYFVFNAAIIYYAGVLIGREGKSRKLILKLSLIWLIGSLSVFKYLHILLNSVFQMSSPLTSMPETTFTEIALPVGISYIVFRLIHYIVEIYRKSLPEHTFWDLAAYVFFFPTFIAGPVDRFQNVQPQIEKQKSLQTSDVNYGLFRIISGFIKKFIIADNLAPVVLPVLLFPENYSGWFIILAVYGLAIQLYMDFSGYTDMAIGISRLFGFKIMENFNFPFFKSNIALFWRNWHMSVYSFIRDYFFFPFFAYRASKLKMYIGMFSTLLVFALWHGATMPYLFLGIYHGLGLVVWQAFQEIKAKHHRLCKFVDSPYMNPFFIFLTFNFVSFSMTVFFVDLQVIWNVFLTLI